jgi:drug/metabolite transporter (DMT)-like permease
MMGIYYTIAPALFNDPAGFALYWHALVLKERIPPLVWAGTGLIFAGIVLISI